MLENDTKIDSLKSIYLKSEYNTDDDNIIKDLYRPCFEVSIRYDRAVGFFRANIYRELGEDLLDFVIKGGKVRIVCSPHIPEIDEKYARNGYELRRKRTELEKKITIIKLLESMSNDPEEKDCLEMLRLLIEKESLDLYIAMRVGGIYHRKIGVFTDKYDNKIVFSGSGNETISGVGSIENWSNDEDFDVFRSWGDEFERKKAIIKEKHLEKLFNGESGRTKVRKLNEVEVEYLQKFRKYKDYEECRKGARTRTSCFAPTKMFIKTNIFPYSYQSEAINSWLKNGIVGMISMPTGVGKTYTALFAIQELLSEGNPILIVVPSNILLNQWKKEILKIYTNIPVLLAGAGHDWKNNPNKRMYISKINKPRIILATMATASSDDFLEFINQSDDLVLIADEAHRLGSPTYRKILNRRYFATMGLSATPIRLFDEEGTKILYDVFGKEPVYHIDIGAKVKIDNKGTEVPILGHFLSRYNYYFYPVDLTTLEKQRWETLSSEIRRLYAIAKSEDNLIRSRNINNRIKLLLIERSRIAKKAENKRIVISQIIKEKYPSNGRWIIYCEDEEQLNIISDEIRENHKDLIVLKYHSKMRFDERERSLLFFEDNPCIIVSIRCLDEGVDIPNADGAIILASSTNPRQYIQRRGRVLRKALGKKSANIIDMLVLPPSDESGIPFSIIRSELGRAWSFSKNAMNQDITHELWKLCMEYGVDIDFDVLSGYEENEGENE